MKNDVAQYLEEAPTRAFSLLKAPSALLRHYGHLNMVRRKIGMPIHKVNNFGAVWSSSVLKVTIATHAAVAN